MDTVATEPYHPAYYMINGSLDPDDMDRIIRSVSRTSLTTATRTCIPVS